MFEIYTLVCTFIVSAYLLVGIGMAIFSFVAELLEHRPWRSQRRDRRSLPGMIVMIVVMIVLLPASKLVTWIENH